jgi:hypothetical protein
LTHLSACAFQVARFLLEPSGIKDFESGDRSFSN